MAELELYREYTFAALLASFGLQQDAVPSGDGLALKDRLLLFYDHTRLDKNWILKESDLFTWTVRWRAYESVESETAPRGEWYSNIQVNGYPAHPSPVSIRQLINQSSRTERGGQAVPLLLFLVSGDQQVYRYLGELFLATAYQHFYRMIDGEAVKLDPPESERIFKIEPRLPQTLWTELTSRLWTLNISGRDTHFADDDALIEQIMLLITNLRASAYLTRYQRDALHFSFANGQSTVVYAPTGAGDLDHFSQETVYPVNPTYQGDPDAKIESVELAMGYEILEEWPANAIFTDSEAFQIIEAYIRGGRLPANWEWRKLRERSETLPPHDLPF